MLLSVDCLSAEKYHILKWVAPNSYGAFVYVSKLWNSNLWWFFYVLEPLFWRILTWSTSMSAWAFFSALAASPIVVSTAVFVLAPSRASLCCSIVVSVPSIWIQPKNNVYYNNWLKSKSRFLFFVMTVWLFVMTLQILFLQQ